MLSVLVGITILLLAACLTTGAARRSSATIRHMIWTCTIAATLLLLPLHWFMPHRAIGQPFPVAVKSALAVMDSVRIAGSPEAPVSSNKSIFGFSEIAVAIWALGSMLFALRFGTQVFQFRRLMLMNEMNDARQTYRRFPVPILTSRRIPGPLVAGIFRPKIVLPADSAKWTSTRRRAVLAHELAHIRRRDPAILLLAHAATIVYWFHPLCWFAAARLRLESEHACDDAVLRIGLRPSSYAGELLDLARLFNPQPALPMAATSHLESRVKSILNPFVNRSSAACRTWIAAALITGVFTAPLCVFSLRAQAPARQNMAAIQAAGIGTISGVIMDPTGAVVPRVVVIASNRELGNKEIVTADAIGNFAFNNIPAGTYSLEVEAPGFAAFRTDLSLSTGAIAPAPVRLKVGGRVLGVTVTAEGTPKNQMSSTTLSGRPIRVGGNVQAARLLQPIQPVYPEALQTAGIEGTVLLEAVISKDGVPDSMVPQNTSVDPAFVNAAMDAVRQWRYSPALLNGEPIELLTTITVDFKLQSQRN